MIKRTYVYPADMIVKTEVSEGKYRVAPYSNRESYSITKIPDRYDTDEKKYLLAGQAFISAFKNEYNIWSCCQSGNSNEYFIHETERFKRIISVSITPFLSSWESFFIKAFVNIANKEIDEYVGTELVECADNVGTQFQNMEDLINYVIRELIMKDRKNCFKVNAVLVHGNIVNNHVLVWSCTGPMVETDGLPFV